MVPHENLPLAMQHSLPPGIYIFVWLNHGRMFYEKDYLDGYGNAGRCAGC